MGTPFWHYVGVFLLFAAWVLLLVTSISAPVLGDIAIAKVILTNFTDIRHSSIVFGSFGYCVLDVPPVTTDQDWCGPKHVGYTPADVMSQVDGPGFQLAHPDAINNLTDGFVLHPIAAFVAFVAFVIALIPVWLMSLLGALTALLAFFLSVIVMAIDFAVFKPIKDAVNSDGSGSVMSFSIAMWFVVTATICLFLGSIIVFLSCCSTRGSYKSGGGDSRRRSYFGRGF